MDCGQAMLTDQCTAFQRFFTAEAQMKWVRRRHLTSGLEGRTRSGCQPAGASKEGRRRSMGVNWQPLPEWHSETHGLMESEDEFWSSILGLLSDEEEPTGVKKQQEESSEHSSSSSSTETSRPPRRRRVRVSLKAQIDYLREQCADLQTQRQRLGRFGCRDDVAPVRSKQSTRRVEIWKRLAMRQYSHRRESESENDQLKRKVVEQTRLFQHLVRLAQRCHDIAKPVPRTQCFEFTSATDVSAKNRLRDELIESSVRFFNTPDELERLETLLMDAEKQEVNEAFTDYPKNRGVLPARWTVAPGVTIIQARSLPYDYSACADAIWDQFAGDVCEMHTGHSVFSRGFETMLHDPVLSGRYEGILAGQRVVHANQSVVTWAIDLTSSPSVATSLTFRVYGCHVVRKSSAGSRGSVVLSEMVTFMRGDCWMDLKRRTKSRIVQFAEKSSIEFQDLLQRRLDGVGYAMRPFNWPSPIECS